MPSLSTREASRSRWPDQNRQEYFQAAVDFEDAIDLCPENKALRLEYKKLQGVSFTDINGWGNEQV